MNQSEDKSTRIVMIVLALVGGAILVCCGGGVGMFYWIWNASDFDGQVRNEIADNPVIVEHIGGITSFESDYGHFVDEDLDYVWVFNISGERGSGSLRAECITVDEWTESVPRAELTLDNGNVFQLFPDNPLPARNQRDVGVRVVLGDHPVVVEHIGEIARFESDYDLWLEEDGMDVWPFHVEGEKGKGLLRAECITEDDFIYEVPRSILKLETGDVFQLFPENPLE